MPQIGDILLIRYKIDPLGWIIQWFINSRWNHSTFIIDEKYLFDCTSAGNKVKPIKKYQKKFLYEIKLIRFVTLTDEEKVRIYKKVIELSSFKKPGDPLFVLALIQVALKKKPIINVCSGTVAYFFKSIGINLVKNKPYYLVSPEDLNQLKDSIDVTHELC